MHAEEYDKAVLQHNWPYKLSNELGTPAHNTRLGTPILSLVVAGDQVSLNPQSIQDSHLTTNGPPVTRPVLGVQYYIHVKFICITDSGSKRSWSVAEEKAFILVSASN